MRTIRRVIVHHSGSDRDTWASIVRYHVSPPPKGRGWYAVGYHLGIDRDGTVWPGRREDRQGAHSTGENHDSLGICLVGDLRGKRWADIPTAQREAAEAQVAKWLQRFGLTASDVTGHRENGPTECPGIVDLDRMRAAIAARMGCP